MKTATGVVDEAVAAEEKDEIDGVDDDREVDPSADPEVLEDEACGPAGQAGDSPAAAGAAGPAAAAAPATIRVSSLQGAGLRFGRDLATPKPHTFPVAPEFKDVLEQTVRLVVRRAPEEFGRLVSITSAGMLVDKPGMHGKGRACDWDAWTFANVEIAPVRREHVSSSQAARQRYWALAALCRSMSSFVLHAEFNAAHEDHIHQDDGGGSIAFRSGSTSTVQLAQAVCNEIYGQSPALPVDGTFGTPTQKALARALRRVDLDGDVNDPDVWRKFLRRSGRLGFRLSI